MAKLDPANFGDRHMYGYLAAFKQIHAPFDQAGDVRIADLTYWNSTDPDSSREKGANFAWGLHQSCIQNASVWGSAFKGDAKEHAKAMSAFIHIMQSPEKLVSDMAEGLSSLFSFSA